MLVIFTLLFLAQMFFHIFKGISPMQVRRLPPCWHIFGVFTPFPFWQYVQRPRLSSEDGPHHTTNPILVGPQGDQDEEAAGGGGAASGPSSGRASGRGSPDGGGDSAFRGLGATNGMVADSNSAPLRRRRHRRNKRFVPDVLKGSDDAGLAGSYGGRDTPLSAVPGGGGFGAVFSSAAGGDAGVGGRGSPRQPFVDYGATVETPQHHQQQPPAQQQQEEGQLLSDMSPRRKKQQQQKHGDEMDNV